ncbi:hypothetical protein ElyMa_000297500 [Elysia marginata]|uniref:Uncharacterized protein n=1 Tax=Elysia marginata TaxID=1093978 RepID=A0AAV4F8E6_9GAST|nr:hypothetical protein ElyMa_000297500 [Elysia marginata]
MTWRRETEAAMASTRKTWKELEEISPDKNVAEDLCWRSVLPGELRGEEEEEGFLFAFITTSPAVRPPPQAGYLLFAVKVDPSTLFLNVISTCIAASTPGTSTNEMSHEFHFVVIVKLHQIPIKSLTLVIGQL